MKKEQKRAAQAQIALEEIRRVAERERAPGAT
jgi:hypothetical protein